MASLEGLASGYVHRAGFLVLSRDCMLFAIQRIQRLGLGCPRHRVPSCVAVFVTSCLLQSMWGFTKSRTPNLDPRTIGSPLMQRTPQRHPLLSEAPMSTIVDPQPWALSAQTLNPKSLPPCCASHVPLDTSQLRSLPRKVGSPKHYPNTRESL